MKICKECKRKYDQKKAEWLYGDYFYLSGFCSKKCHDKDMVRSLEELDNDGNFKYL